MSHLEVGRLRPDVALITLNRPDKLNALNFGLVEELRQTPADLDSDGDCRVVVLIGAGRGFCSGLDLTDPFPAEAGRGREARGRACGGRNASPN